MADAAPAYRSIDLEESPFARRVRARLKEIALEDWPDDWTCEFIDSIVDHPNLDLLSGKQTAVVNKILRRAEVRAAQRCSA